MILFGLRFYDPAIGRWISQDPAGSIDGPNLYAYLHNNPLNHIDRFGLATENSQNKFDEYFYGEVETHCYCERHRTCKRGGDIGNTASTALPKITYNDEFENYYKDYRVGNRIIEKNYYENSSCYDLEDHPDFPNDLGIVSSMALTRGLQMRNSMQNTSQSSLEDITSMGYIMRHMERKLTSMNADLGLKTLEQSLFDNCTICGTAFLKRVLLMPNF